jgi:hypothetical protein
MLLIRQGEVMLQVELRVYGPNISANFNWPDQGSFTMIRQTLMRSPYV